MQNYSADRRINESNNHAASLLTLGRYDEAVTALREAFSVLSDLTKGSENTGQCELLAGWSPPPSKDDRNRHVFVSSASNDSTLSISSTTSSYLYIEPFIFTDGDCSDLDLAIKSAATIFNMALAHHRLVLQTSSRSPKWGVSVHKMLTFYTLAAELAQRPALIWHVDAMMIALAAMNNMGQIHFDLLCDCNAAKECFGRLSSIMAENPSGADQAMAPPANLMPGTAFHRKDRDGIFANLLFVQLLGPDVAPAA